MYKHIPPYLPLSEYMYGYIHIYIYIYVRIYMKMHIYIYIQISMHADVCSGGAIVENPNLLIREIRLRRTQGQVQTDHLRLGERIQSDVDTHRACHGDRWGTPRAEAAA